MRCDHLGLAQSEWTFPGGEDEILH
jgi:hypothetical protein